ncbi:AT-rich interactive domain-containing protein 3C [Amphibalanus amphitrite]|uniref:AT-rich interactive domain-containing protein 3C n=1 Tax=Amphibalanus amphitrite TaxID=1232801 RepID=A0A6A4VP47_AMPAM|nr:AT-rich interactive domain-containing protein 3C [Amphibalanus amphitrite]
MPAARGMYDVAVRGPTVTMEETETPAEVVKSGVMTSSAWGAAAEQYRQLLQHQHSQHQHRGADDEGAVSDADSAPSRGQSPLEGGSDVETNHRPIRHQSPEHGVLEKLKRQVASVSQAHTMDTSDESSDYRLQDGMMSRASADPSSLPRHRLSPQSLLAASMASNPPSLVPLPGLGGLAGYGGAAGRASSASPPAREAASPPTSSSGHSPRQPAAATGTGNTQAPWNYEEQFKQLYEIDENPKRKEFLDELFRFMQERVRQMMGAVMRPIPFHLTETAVDSCAVTQFISSRAATCRDRC